MSEIPLSETPLSGVPETWSHGRLSWVVLALLLLFGSLMSPVMAQSGNGDPDLPTYTTTLKTAYFPLFPGQDMFVTVADLATDSPGASLTIRFYDTDDELLGTSRGELAPGEVVKARLEGGFLVFEEGRTLVRVEIAASSQLLGAKPVTTIERFDPDAFVSMPDWKCAGPHMDCGPDFSCQIICPGAVQATDVTF